MCCNSQLFVVDFSYFILYFHFVQSFKYSIYNKILILLMKNCSGTTHVWINWFVLVLCWFPQSHPSSSSLTFWTEWRLNWLCLEIPRCFTKVRLLSQNLPSTWNIVAVLRECRSAECCRTKLCNSGKNLWRKAE